MTVSLSPLARMQFNQGGIPLAGGRLFTYAAGTTTKLATYTDSTGATPNTNPIVLDANGQCDLWLTDGAAYKLVLSPSTDTDPPTNPFWTEDNVSNNLIPFNPTFNNVAVAGTLNVTGLTTLASLVAATFNKVTITQPMNAATLTIANNKTLTASNTLMLSGTDGAAVNFGAGGTPVYTGAATASGLTMSTGKLLGRTTAATGAIEEISVVGAALSGGVLTISAPITTASNITTSTTIASSTANVLYKVTMTTHGQAIFFPDATTLNKGGPIYQFVNTTGYYSPICDTGGNVKGFLPPLGTVTVYLNDNSTANGVWTLASAQPLGLSAESVNMTLANMANVAFQAIALDSNRDLLLFGGTDCYAMVWDRVNGWGSATLIRASISSGAFIGIKSAANQVTICTCDSTTGMQTVVCTISSNTTITPDTANKASTTLAGNWSSFDYIILNGSTIVLAYSRATTTAELRAIAISGTTPTVSNATALSANAVVAGLYNSGSVVRAVYSASTTLYVTPYTISGSIAPAKGTEATTTVSSTTICATQNANGNIFLHFLNTTNQVGVAKLTTTTEAITTIQLSTQTIAINASGQWDRYLISAAKWAMVYHAGSTVLYANIATDTAGTVSVGTEASITVPSTLSWVIAPFLSGTTLSAFAGGAVNTISVSATVDCSGASPTFSVNSLPLAPNVTNGWLIPAVATPTDGTRISRQIRGTSYATQIASPSGGLFALTMSPGHISSRPNMEAQTASVFSNVGTTGLIGTACWTFGAVTGGTTGYRFQKWECMA